MMPISKSIFKSLSLILLVGSISSCSATSQTLDQNGAVKVDEAILSLSIYQKRWDYGSENCETSTGPVIDTFAIDESTVVLRQNKCTTFEAPFIFAFSGTERTLVIDSGALEKETDSPVVSTIDELLNPWYQKHPKSNQLLLVHSHGHGDHKAGDEQFVRRGNANIVKPEVDAIKAHFGIQNWPIENAVVDLGDRTITVIPTPGHLEDALTFYDSKTKMLFTGDSFYPGFVYVKDWQAYQSSMQRLTDFAMKNDVVAILGTHVEMSKTPGEIYPIGSLYQPEEIPLPLSRHDLFMLNERLQKAEKPQEIILEKIIVRPLNSFQKVLSNIFS